MRLIPGKLVVLEGIDATGKSTQLERLRDLLGDELYTHQPSGDTMVGQAVYSITEKSTNLTPLARQFLHLAAHSEQYEKVIIPALSDRGVIMDRCWWSTVAYGWFDGGLKHLIDLIDFIRLVRLPTHGVMPDVVFVFMHAWKQDRHNTIELCNGYEYLTLDLYPEVMEPMEIGTPEEQTAQIMAALERRGLLDPN